MSASTAGSSRRFETVARFQQAAGEHGFATALHLCGVYTRELMASEGAISSTLELCEGFGRVQVNLHGDYWGDKAIVVNGERIIRFAETVTRGSVPDSNSPAPRAMGRNPGAS